MRWPRSITFWGFLLTIVGVATLSAIMWSPPGDRDAKVLAAERSDRLRAFKRGQPMPGAIASMEPLEKRLSTAGFKLGAPIFIRIHKREFELEVWLKNGSQYAHFATYPICYFSGQLGPKLRTGDRQSPEGIYSVNARQLNPRSRWHRAFNLGFPNAYDQFFGRTGSFLMVHGGCSSVGCYAITNSGIDDVFRLASTALAVGQSGFQVQALPFRMTQDALKSRSTHIQAEFWSELKTIADAFDQTRLPPDIAICDGHYRLASLNNGTGSACRKL